MFKRIIFLVGLLSMSTTLLAHEGHIEHGFAITHDSSVVFMVAAVLLSVVAVRLTSVLGKKTQTHTQKRDVK